MKTQVTVVIPSHCRADLLEALINSIRIVEATDAIPTEIILTDSTHFPERGKILLMCNRFDVKYIECQNSVSEKRNIGAQIAESEYILFVDSDCELEPGCLLSHIEMLSNERIDASCGIVNFFGHESLVFKAVKESGILTAFSAEKGTEYISWGPTANIMIKKSAFLEFGFDPLLGPPGYGGEDVDFGLRFTEHGYKMIRNPSAKVKHSTQTWNFLADNISRFKAWGAADAHLVKRHTKYSVVDMPSPAIVLTLYLILIIIMALYHPWAIVAGLLGLVIYFFISSGFSFRKDLLHLILAQFVYIVLDYSRIIEAIKKRLLPSAIRRLKFSENQISDEWNTLMYSSYASHFLLLFSIILLICFRSKG